MNHSAPNWKPGDFVYHCTTDESGQLVTYRHTVDHVGPSGVTIIPDGQPGIRRLVAPDSVAASRIEAARLTLAIWVHYLLKLDTQRRVVAGKVRQVTELVKGLEVSHDE